MPPTSTSPVIHLLANFGQISTWKIWFRRTKKDFSWKENDSNSPDFEEKNSKLPGIYDES
jgi:hypothetical protein